MTSFAFSAPSPSTSPAPYPLHNSSYLPHISPPCLPPTTHHPTPSHIFLLPPSQLSLFIPNLHSCSTLLPFTFSPPILPFPTSPPPPLLHLCPPPHTTHPFTFPHHISPSPHLSFPTHLPSPSPHLSTPRSPSPHTIPTLLPPHVDNSTSDLLVLLQRLSSQYEATMRNLELINATIGSTLGVVTDMNSAINSQMGWIVEQMGGTKEALRLLTVCSGHLLFLLLATLCVVFVSAPPPSRVALLVMVVGNVVAEIKFGASLSLQSLCLLEASFVACKCIPGIAFRVGSSKGSGYLFKYGWLEFLPYLVDKRCVYCDMHHVRNVATILSPRLMIIIMLEHRALIGAYFLTTGNWLLMGFWRRKRMDSPVRYLPPPPPVASSRTEPYPLKHHDPPLTKPSLDTTFSDDEDAAKESVKMEVFNVSADLPLHDTSLSNFPLRAAPQFSTPTKSSAAAVVTHSTPRSALGQQQCASLTKAGFKCRLPAMPGLGYCRRHAQ